MCIRLRLLRRESRLRLLRLDLVVAKRRPDGGRRGHAADDLLRLEGAGVCLAVELTADVEVTYN